MISIKIKWRVTNSPENEQGKMETFEVLYSWQPNMFEMQQKLGQEPSNTWGNLYEYILEPMLHLIILTKCPVQKLKKITSRHNPML